MKKIYSLLILFSFICPLSYSLASDEAFPVTKNTQAVQTESVAPDAVPGDFLYYWVLFKRGVKSMITFDPVKKTELDLKTADEMVLEIRVLANRGDKERTAKHLSKYNRLIAKIQKRNEGLVEKTEVQEKKLAETIRRNLSVILEIERGLPADLLNIAHNEDLSFMIKVKQIVYGTAHKINTKIKESYQTVIDVLENNIIGKISERFSLPGGEDMAKMMKKPDSKKTDKEEKEAKHPAIPDADGTSATETPEVSASSSESTEKLTKDEKDELKEDKEEVKTEVKEDKEEVKTEVKEDKEETTSEAQEEKDKKTQNEKSNLPKLPFHVNENAQEKSSDNNGKKPEG